ncbi:hypothetical protein U1Q18_048978 [Sarracenia purpurea var. burkii]
MGLTMKNCYRIPMLKNDIHVHDQNNQQEIHVRNLIGFSLSSTFLYINDDEDRDFRFQDPLHEKVAEVFNSFASGKFSEAELSDRIENVINSFNVKSPIRCKLAFIDQLSEVNDAVNLIAKNENVFRDELLEF